MLDIQLMKGKMALGESPLESGEGNFLVCIGKMTFPLGKSYAEFIRQVTSTVL